MPALPQYMTLRQLKELHGRILFSKTDLVSKTTDGSLVNALLFAGAKASQMALKDVAIAAAGLFPDAAHGDQLDAIAENYGVPGRLGPTKASMYVRFSAEQGVAYPAGTTVQTDEGVDFELLEPVVVGEHGFAYGLAKSTTPGASANTSAFSASGSSVTPEGHRGVANEFAAFGGRDAESDADMRARLKDSFNVVSQGTYRKLALVLSQTQPSVLRVISHGLDANGRLRLAVVGRSGERYTATELTEMTEALRPYLSLSSRNVAFVREAGLSLVNVDYFPVDVSFRCRLDPSYDFEALRRRLQTNVNSLFDPSGWTGERKVEWDDILLEVKRTLGVDYVADASFVPRVDLTVPPGSLPRVRMFQIRDLAGGLLYSGSDKLSPVDYEALADPTFLATVLESLS